MSSIYPVVWNSIPDEVKANPDLATAILTLNQSYNSPAQPTDVDYNHQMMRYAYYYRHFTSTVYCISNCWYKFRLTTLTLDRLFDDLMNLGVVKILSLGGSGADIVGFCHWIGSRYFRLRIDSVVVDKYNWSAESTKILTRFPICTQRASANPDYCFYDFANTELDDDFKAQIKKAEIFTIVKFLSTVPCNKVKMLQKLTEVFKFLQKSALVMYMDVINTENTVVINDAANIAGLRPVGYLAEVTLNVQPHEADAMRVHHLAQFQPVQEEHLTASLWQK